MDWSHFTLRDGKQVIAAPCVDIVAFSFDPPDAAGGKGFDRAVRAFAGRYGRQLAFYRTGDMKRFRRVEPGTLDAPYHWFSDPKVLAAKMLALVAHAGPVERSALPPGIKLTLWGFDQPPAFTFRLVLPVEAADAPDDIVAFVQDAFAEFPLHSGYCGYSFVWDESAADEEANAWAGPLLLRHPGLNYEAPVTLARAAADGVVAVSWLTMLGAGVTTDLGGVKALAKAADEGVSVLPLGQGGVLLRAGAAPELGDVNRRQRLPLYQAVGKVVSPRRASDEELDELYIEGMSEEAALDWLHRFFV